ncbi:MAG: FKBP-type peptidylprolyl cis-trans isomerase [Parcubacteria group bacterium]|nr:FKBP-type peptidylprolyl cis-trans isomerase [Parcubacteria group bacterium]
MNITATAVAVTLAVVISMAFLFLGPSIFRPFQPQARATVEQVTTDTMATTSDSTSAAAPQGQPQGAAVSGPLPTKLTITDEIVGTGPAAKAGDTVTVNYVGSLPDGTVFDASAKHGQAFSFQLGAQQVIAGWDQGLVGMKVGGKRKLVIPPDMAYGNRDLGVIPPNSTLVFEVELVKIGQ